MRIIAIFYFDQHAYKYVQDLSFVSSLNRNSVSELMHEFVKSTEKTIRDHCKIFEYTRWQLVCHRVHEDNAVMVTDNEYPTNVSFELLRKVQESPDIMTNILSNCQDPRTVSNVYRVRVDEMLVIIHEKNEETINCAVDEIVEKSENLSNQARTFYKVVKKHNQCCII
tara:strand:+ start:10064 stop:10567 length:504 start_codon:yes stop_codon:yes gene_type:complete